MNDETFCWVPKNGRWTKKRFSEEEFREMMDHFEQKAESEATVDRLLSDFEPDTSYYEFPGGVEVRQISAHLMSFPSQIVQYASRSGRVDGNCKSEDVADKIRDFEKVIDFAKWEIERLKESK